MFRLNPVVVIIVSTACPSRCRSAVAYDMPRETIKTHGALWNISILHDSWYTVAEIPQIYDMKRLL
jgi:hypothetical protein